MAEATGLNFGRDAHGYNAYAPVPSNNIWTATLADGTASSITLPTLGANQYWVVSFRYQPGTSVYVDITGATALLPVGGTLASSTSELNPASLKLVPGNNISMITGNTTAEVAIVAFQVAELA